MFNRATCGKLGVAALGGGLNGCFSVGVWDYFWSHNIIPDVIQPISVNVLNTVSIISENSIEPLKDLWRDIERRGPTTVFRYTEMFGRILLKRNSLFTTKTIDWLTRQHANVERFYKSPILVEIVARNESKDQELAFFSNRLNHPPIQEDEERLRKIIHSSVALAGVFPPIFIDDGWYSDGLIFDLDRMVRQGCETIIIISNEHGQQLRNPQCENWFPRLIKGLAGLLDELVVERLAFARAINPDVRFLMIRPTISLPRLNTVHARKGRNDISRAIDHGYERAALILAEH